MGPFIYGKARLSMQNWIELIWGEQPLKSKQFEVLSKEDIANLVDCKMQAFTKRTLFSSLDCCFFMKGRLLETIPAACG